jgi:hypothetical protein
MEEMGEGAMPPHIKAILDFMNSLPEKSFQLAAIEKHMAWKFLNLEELDFLLSDEEMRGLQQLAGIEEETKNGNADASSQKLRQTPEQLALLAKLNSVLQELTLFEFLTEAFEEVDLHFQNRSNTKYEQIQALTLLLGEAKKRETLNNAIFELEKVLTGKIGWISVGNKSLQALSNPAAFNDLTSRLKIETEEQKANSSTDEFLRLRNKYHNPTIDDILEMETEEAFKILSDPFADFMANNLEELLEVKNDVLLLTRLRDENPVKLESSRNESSIPINGIKTQSQIILLVHFYIKSMGIDLVNIDKTDLAKFIHLLLGKPCKRMQNSEIYKKVRIAPNFIRDKALASDLRIVKKVFELYDLSKAIKLVDEEIAMCEK